MQLEKLEWLWKTHLGALIAGLTAGVLAGGFFFQTQLTTYRDLIASLQREVENARNEKVQVETRLSDETKKVVSDYKAQLAALQTENESIRANYQSLFDRYELLASAYRSTASVQATQAMTERLLLDLRKQEQALTVSISEKHQRIASLSNDLGKSKQRCSDHQADRNYFAVSEVDCQRYESMASLLQAIRDQIASEEKTLSSVQDRIAKLARTNG